MAAISCPNCGADLTAPQSVRIAEYQCGHLRKIAQEPMEGPGFVYHFEVPDTYTILCNACKRLVRTLPTAKNEPGLLFRMKKGPKKGPFFIRNTGDYDLRIRGVMKTSSSALLSLSTFERKSIPKTRNLGQERHTRDSSAALGGVDPAEHGRATIFNQDLGLDGLAKDGGATLDSPAEVRLGFLNLDIHDDGAIICDLQRHIQLKVGLDECHRDRTTRSTTLLGRIRNLLPGQDSGLLVVLSDDLGAGNDLDLAFLLHGLKDDIHTEAITQEGDRNCPAGSGMGVFSVQAVVAACPEAVRLNPPELFQDGPVPPTVPQGASLPRHSTWRRHCSRRAT